MAPIPTTLIITPQWGTKTLNFEGKISVYESVNIVVVDAADDGNVPAGFVLRMSSLCGRVDYARFPLQEDDHWEVDGGDLVCNIILNTTKLVREFKGLCADDRIPCRFSLESGVANNLYAAGRLHIRNWPQNPEMPTVDGGVFKERVDALENDIDAVADQFIAHAHKGIEDNSQQIEHGDLLSAGTMTHAQLEDTLSQYGGSLNNHVNNTGNPHEVTATQVGLGNVDNTSDVDKPVSNATKNALNNKANKSVVDELLNKLSVASSLNNINPDTSTDYAVRECVKAIVNFLQGLV